MLYTKIDSELDIAILEADGPLSRSDFERSTSVFREYVKDNGKLKGMAVYTKRFPGWRGLSVIPFHFKYAIEHRYKADKVALVTDSPLAVFIRLFGTIVFGAKAKVFKYGEIAKAKEWLAGKKCDYS